MNISGFLTRQFSFPSANFIANEMKSIQASFLRLKLDFNATGTKMDNLEKSYVKAMINLSGMLPIQEQAQIKSDNIHYIQHTAVDTTGTGLDSKVQDNSVVTDNSSSYCDNAGKCCFEVFIYEEEEGTFNSYNEDYLTTEDLFFAASILDPTNSGICLSSASPDLFNFQMSLESIVPIADGRANVYHNRLLRQGIYFSPKTSTITADTSRLHEYTFRNKIAVHIFNQYRIFLWDPGILLSLYSISF